MLEEVQTGRAPLEKTDRARASLQKEFTITSGVAVIVGQIIGSGIFITPRSILHYGGSFGVCILMWLAGGFVSMAGGLCYIELGLLVKKGGGESGYLMEAYSLKKKNKWSELCGSMLGFLFVWGNICILRPASLGVQSLTFARYLTRSLYGDDEVPQYLVKGVALTALALITVINSISVKTTARAVTFFATSKIVAVVFVAMVGVVFTLHKGTYPEAFNHPFQPTEGHVTSPATIALAMYGVLWSYDGWNAMNYAIEETKDVARTLPLSLLIGIPIVTFSYLVVNFSFFATLSYEQILESDAIALPFGEATLGKLGLLVIPLLVAVATFGSLIGSMFAGSRVTFNAARDSLLPECVGGIHKNFKTPLPAIILLFSMASALLVVGDISDLIEGCSASTFLFYWLVIIGLIIMRFTHREEPRLFKAWFILPVAGFMVVVFSFLVFLPLFLQPVPSLVAFSVVLLGVPVYFFFVMEKPWRLRPKILDTISGQPIKPSCCRGNRQPTWPCTHPAGPALPASSHHAGPCPGAHLALHTPGTIPPQAPVLVTSSPLGPALYLFVRHCGIHLRQVWQKQTEVVHGRLAYHYNLGYRVLIWTNTLHKRIQQSGNLRLILFHLAISTFVTVVFVLYTVVAILKSYDCVQCAHLLLCKEEYTARRSP